MMREESRRGGGEGYEKEREREKGGREVERKREGGRETGIHPLSQPGCMCWKVVHMNPDAAEPGHYLSHEGHYTWTWI